MQIRGGIKLTSVCIKGRLLSFFFNRSFIQISLYWKFFCNLTFAKFPVREKSQFQNLFLIGNKLNDFWCMRGAFTYLFGFFFCIKSRGLFKKKKLALSSYVSRPRQFPLDFFFVLYFSRVK